MAREDADAHGRHDPRARAIVLLCVALLSRSGAAAAPSVQLSAPRPLFSRMAKSGRATRNMTLYRVTPVKLRGVADRCSLHPSICPLAPCAGCLARTARRRLLSCACNSAPVQHSPRWLRLP